MNKKTKINFAAIAMSLVMAGTVMGSSQKNNNPISYESEKLTISPTEKTQENTPAKLIRQMKIEFQEVGDNKLIATIVEETDKGNAEINTKEKGTFLLKISDDGEKIESQSLLDNDDVKKIMAEARLKGDQVETVIGPNGEEYIIPTIPDEENIPDSNTEQEDDSMTRYNRDDIEALRRGVVNRQLND